MGVLEDEEELRLGAAVVCVMGQIVSPLKRCVGILAPRIGTYVLLLVSVPQNVTVFGERVFSEIIKLK